MTAEPSVSSNLQIVGRDSVSAVSFALFGTLLLRRCAGIEAVYERTLLHAAVPERVRQMADSFVQHRSLALHKSRFSAEVIRRDVSGNVACGISIDTVYANFAFHALNLPKSAAPGLIEGELKAEKELCFLNPDMRSLYEEARRLGRRVGVVAETYWAPDQVRSLLGDVAPDLSFDFIYTSATPQANTAGGVFNEYLKAEGLAPGQAIHVGLDEDATSATAEGLVFIPYDLPKDCWAPHYPRENAAARLLAVSDRGFNWRLDGGLRLLRRMALGTVQPARIHQAVGAAVLGPIAVGFQRYIERQVAELSQPGRRVQVLFLARDGYLPLRIWNAANGGPANYVELNRRIAMIAGSQGEGGFDNLRGLFAAMAQIGPEGVEQFFKIDLTAEMREFFAKYENNLAPGKDFAEAIPDLFDKDLLPRLSDNMRSGLMEYLRAKVDDLDDCTDLVLVDIGYTGNIQKGLRRVFDIEGVTARLHGIYLVPHGEAFVRLPDGDTVCGYFDDTVMTPAVKRAVMRDAILIEEFFCAPVGSTRGYANGREIREEEVRVPRDITFCLEMQDDCVRYYDAFIAAVGRCCIDPRDDFATYRTWTAAIICRFLTMPTPLECQTFGPLLHDVSLGSKGLMATITTADIRNLMGALSFATVCSIHHPPVWLGGSLTAHTAAAGFSYATMALGLGSDDFFRDIEIDGIEAIILKGDRAIPVPVASALTPFGDLRLRIPVLQKDGEAVVALPLKGQLVRGVVRSIILQGGDDLNTAVATRFGESQPLNKIQSLRAVQDGTFFRANGPDPFLLLTVPSLKHPVNVLAVLITPLFEG